MAPFAAWEQERAWGWRVGTFVFYILCAFAYFSKEYLPVLWFKVKAFPILYFSQSSITLLIIQARTIEISNKQAVETSSPSFLLVLWEIRDYIIANSINKVGFVFSIEVSNINCLKLSMTLLRKQNEHMTNVYLTHEWENHQDGKRAFQELSI